VIRSTATANTLFHVRRPADRVARDGAGEARAVPRASPDRRVLAFYLTSIYVLITVVMADVPGPDRPAFFGIKLLVPPLPRTWQPAP
jgi:hypothetical protein